MIDVVKVETLEDMDKARYIRTEVFVKEQKCPAEEEFDNYDNTAIHFIAFYDGKLASCARLLTVNESIYKIGRIAVLSQFRKKGIGKKMCMHIIDKIKSLGGKIVKLDAQIHAKGFYESMGFTAQGEEFMEVNIPHITMIKNLF